MINCTNPRQLSIEEFNLKFTGELEKKESLGQVCRSDALGGIDRSVQPGVVISYGVPWIKRPACSRCLDYQTYAEVQR